MNLRTLHESIHEPHSQWNNQTENRTNVIPSLLCTTEQLVQKICGQPVWQCSLARETNANESKLIWDRVRVSKKAGQGSAWRMVHGTPLGLHRARHFRSKTRASLARGLKLRSRINIWRSQSPRSPTASLVDVLLNTLYVKLGGGE